MTNTAGGSSGGGSVRAGARVAPSPAAAIHCGGDLSPAGRGGADWPSPGRNPNTQSPHTSLRRGEVAERREAEKAGEGARGCPPPRGFTHAVFALVAVVLFAPLARADDPIDSVMY